MKKHLITALGLVVLSVTSSAYHARKNVVPDFANKPVLHDNSLFSDNTSSCQALNNWQDSPSTRKGFIRFSPVAGLNFAPVACGVDPAIAWQSFSAEASADYLASPFLASRFSDSQIKANSVAVEDIQSNRQAALLRESADIEVIWAARTYMARPIQDDSRLIASPISSIGKTPVPDERIASISTPAVKNDLRLEESIAVLKQYRDDAVTVPEPASGWLLGLGILGMIWRKRKCL